MPYPLLSNTTIIESSAFVPAPLAGLALAQFGADVIRVDMIEGGIDYKRAPRMPSNGRSLYWTSLNAGKRSVAIDLRHPEGRELLQNLVITSGNLLTNRATPWLSHSILSQRRSDLISCLIEGNADGSSAMDCTVNCATGFPFITGLAGRQSPVNHQLPAWDIGCAYQAAFALVVAINRRLVTGEGAAIRLALSDVALTTVAHLGMFAEAELLEQERPATGNHLTGAFGHDFVTADGERVMIAAISLGQWKALVNCCGLGQAITHTQARLGLNFDDEVQRFEVREQIKSLFQHWFATRTYAEAEASLNDAGVAWARYSSVRETLTHDRRVGAANPIYERLHTPGVGEHLSAQLAARFESIQRQPGKGAPLLGTDTDEVLETILGLPSHTIARLHDRGIVAGPDADPHA